MLPRVLHLSFPIRLFSTGLNRYGYICVPLCRYDCIRVPLYSSWLCLYTPLSSRLCLCSPFLLWPCTYPVCDPTSPVSSFSPYIHFSLSLPRSTPPPPPPPPVPIGPVQPPPPLPSRVPIGLVQQTPPPPRPYRFGPADTPIPPLSLWVWSRLPPLLVSPVATSGPPAPPCSVLSRYPSF